MDSFSNMLVDLSVRSKKTNDDRKGSVDKRIIGSGRKADDVFQVGGLL